MVNTNPRPIFFKILKHSILHRDCIDIIEVRGIRDQLDVTIY